MYQYQPSLDVVMATYNGAGFLDEQIRSVLSQSLPPRQLLVRDDNSTDDTPAVVGRYASHGDSIVRMLADHDHLGACGNFSRLIEGSDADYVMPCDQDDVWLLDKISVTFAVMQRLEERYGPSCPILVHTDLQVTDSKLNPVSPSFWAYERLDPNSGATLPRLLLQNVVTGCTVMANRALLRKAMPIPREAIMHDWWLALAAAAFGQLAYLPKPTMLYRQHSRNRVGAKELDAKYAISKGVGLLTSRNVARQLRDTQSQAQVFLDRFGAELSDEHRIAVEAYATVRHRGFLGRRVTLVRHGLYKHGWLRNIGLFASI